MTTSHGRSGNLSENFFRNSREFAVALKLAFLNLERLPFGVMSVRDVSRLPACHAYLPSAHLLSRVSFALPILLLIQEFLR